MHHELVHVRQKHWFDLLLAELLCMIQWFNPLVWIYIRFIRQNHEYLADEVALQRTSDPAVYKAVLLNQIVGAPVVSLTNSFNYSLNKKRFNMMKNIISSPYRKMKILLILPVFAILLYAFAKPDYRYKYVDESPVSIVSGNSLQQNSVKGTVVQQDGKPLAAANITITGTTTGTITDLDGHFKLNNIPDGESLVISFVGFKSKVLKPDFTSEMYIIMVRDTVRYNNLNIGTPPPPPPPPPMNAAGDKNVPPPPPPASGIDIKEDGPQPLYVIDGSITTKADLKKINPESIEAISVLKYHSDTINPALYEYGEKGKNGVIVITTKKKASETGNTMVPPPPPPPSTDLKILSENGETPLIVVDGTIKDIDLNKIDQGTIESITVLKDKSATEKYGEKGKNGVLEITTKKEAVEHPFVVVEELPQFPGGRDAMRAWIHDNMNYPQEAINKKIQGQIIVSFVVTSKGKVKNVKVIKPLYPELDIEASRIVSNMPEWKPGSQGGKPVDVQMQVPVEFKLK
jgi:TonB family protein